jgi:multidrug efflux pump subunit AcrB
MLVDNAIVLVENIYRHLEMGKDLMAASVDGANEVAGAVTASTLTTVAAFAPLVFWTGIMGQFMGYLPKTVVIVLVSSLLVAVGILPVLTSRLMKRSKAKKGKHASDEETTGIIAPSYGPVMRAYRWVLEQSIHHRYLSALLVNAALIGTFVAYGQLNHGTQFFPEVEPDQATITVRAPDGTDLEATDKIVRRIEELLAEEPNIDTFVAETGVSGGADPTQGVQAAGNQARITVDFPPHWTKRKEGEAERLEDTRKTIDRIRQKVSEIPGAQFVVEKQRMGPPVGAPVGVEVSGDDFHRVGALAARMRREIAAIDGVTDVSDNYRVGRPEMRMRIDRGAAKRVGASTQAVAGAVRTAVAGTKASTLRDGEDEHDIVVELAPRYKGDLQAVLGLRIPGREDTSPDTFAVPISAVASYELAGGSGAIRHIDQDRVVTITGDVLEGFNENAVREAVSAHITDAERPQGYHLRLGGANDEQKKAQTFLSNAFLVAIFLIAMVLVSQFNSYMIPGIILGTVVLSLVGVLWGLIITGTPFGIIMTGLGVISLAGVVVNNAIVLLDYVQQLRDEGLSVREALVEAGTVRFRPVMLTAVTTILGLVPMAAGISIDFAGGRMLFGSQSADWWGPMAVAVIFGLAFATLLTLVMVPTFYSILEDLRGLPARVFRRARPAEPAPGE